MSTNFPTSLDSIPNVNGADLIENATNTMDHDAQHNNVKDAVQALQAKVGINSSGVTTSLDYKVAVTLPAAIAALGWTHTSGQIAATTTTDKFIVGVANTEYVSGTENKMYFDPATGSVRGGQIADTSWNSANRGTGSTAFGYSTKASGAGSTAIGQSCQATGAQSVALGWANIASGAESFTAGTSATASATRSVCIGYATAATGQYGIALGQNSTAIRHAQLAFASTTLANPGDSQYNKFVAALITTNATPTVMTFNQSAVALTAPTANVLTVPISKAHRVTINAVARRTDSTSDGAAWTITGTIVRGASGNAAFIATPGSVTEATAGASAWTLVATINTSDATNNYLALTATGQVGATIRWVADINSAEVG